MTEFRDPLSTVTPAAIPAPAAAPPAAAPAIGHASTGETVTVLSSVPRSSVEGPPPSSASPTEVQTDAATKANQIGQNSLGGGAIASPAPAVGSQPAILEAATTPPSLSSPAVLDAAIVVGPATAILVPTAAEAAAPPVPSRTSPEYLARQATLSGTPQPPATAAPPPEAPASPEKSALEKLKAEDERMYKKNWDDPNYKLYTNEIHAHEHFEKTDAENKQKRQELEAAYPDKNNKDYKQSSRLLEMRENASAAGLQNTQQMLDKYRGRLTPEARADAKAYEEHRNKLKAEFPSVKVPDPRFADVLYVDYEDIKRVKDASTTSAQATPHATPSYSSQPTYTQAQSLGGSPASSSATGYAAPAPQQSQPPPAAGYAAPTPQYAAPQYGAVPPQYAAPQYGEVPPGPAPMPVYQPQVPPSYAQYAAPIPTYTSLPLQPESEIIFKEKHKDAAGNYVVTVEFRGEDYKLTIGGYEHFNEAELEAQVLRQEETITRLINMAVGLDNLSKVYGNTANVKLTSSPSNSQDYQVSYTKGADTKERAFNRQTAERKVAKWDSVITNITNDMESTRAALRNNPPNAPQLQQLLINQENKLYRTQHKQAAIKNLFNLTAQTLMMNTFAPPIPSRTSPEYLQMHAALAQPSPNVPPAFSPPPSGPQAAAAPFAPGAPQPAAPPPPVPRPSEAAMTPLRARSPDIYGPAPQAAAPSSPETPQAAAQASSPLGPPPPPAPRPSEAAMAPLRARSPDIYGPAAQEAAPPLGPPAQPQELSADDKKRLWSEREQLKQAFIETNKRLQSDTLRGEELKMAAKAFETADKALGKFDSNHPGFYEEMDRERKAKEQAQAAPATAQSTAANPTTVQSATPSRKPLPPTPSRPAAAKPATEPQPQVAPSPAAAPPEEETLSSVAPRRAERPATPPSPATQPEILQSVAPPKRVATPPSPTQSPQRPSSAYKSAASPSPAQAPKPTPIPSSGPPQRPTPSAASPLTAKSPSPAQAAPSAPPPQPETLQSVAPAKRKESVATPPSPPPAQAAQSASPPPPKTNTQAEDKLHERAEIMQNVLNPTTREQGKAALKNWDAEWKKIPEADRKAAESAEQEKINKKRGDK